MYSRTHTHITRAEPLPLLFDEQHTHTHQEGRYRYYTTVYIYYILYQCIDACRDRTNRPIHITMYTYIVVYTGKRGESCDPRGINILI